MNAQQTHGGVDALGAARWDFSTNSNAVGPCPVALAAVHAADATRYPDPEYCQIKKALAALHQVDAHRVIMAASASEFITRFTVVSHRLAPGSVAVARHSYGDYQNAARASGRAVVSLEAGATTGATLRWYGDPTSPLGQSCDPPPTEVAWPPSVGVLDMAYAPLRLDGSTAWTRSQMDAVFTLHSPNKALGLTGVRGAYAIAPNVPRALEWINALNAACPSWPIGAHGVAMLAAWCELSTHAWLADSLKQLRLWRKMQIDMLRKLGMVVVPSVSNFFCVTPPVPVSVAALRCFDIKVRDTASFGLPNMQRLSVQPPGAQEALRCALTEILSADTKPRAKQASR